MSTKATARRESPRVLVGSHANEHSVITIDDDSDAEEPFVADLRRHGTSATDITIGSRSDRVAVQDSQGNFDHDELDAAFLAEINEYGIVNS